MSARTPHSVNLIRGNRWTASVKLRIKGDPCFDWTGLTATLRIRAQRGTGTLLRTFTPTVVIDEGVAIVLIDIPGTSFTAAPTLPPKVAADLEVYRASPLFGPYTPARYDITLEPTT